VRLVGLVAVIAFAEVSCAGSRSHLVVGQPIPDVVARDQDGAPVQLRRYLGRPLVVYFYPKDRTSG
jgi:hypothetical protein